MTAMRDEGGDGQSAVDRADEVICQHLWRRPVCKCGWDPQDTGRAWSTHVAEQLAAAGLLAADTAGEVAS